MGIETNMSSLISRLENIEKKAQKDIAKNGLNKGADILKNGCMETCPKDTHHLEESIDKADYKGGSNSSIKVKIVGDEDVKRYGYYQEFGTEKMVGKKWMKQASIKYKGEAVNAMAESIFNDLGIK